MMKKAQLLQTLQYFYKLAAEASVEDEDVYQKAKSISSALKREDANLSDELSMLAELYMKAVEYGTGYNIIYNNISNLIQELSDLDEDNELLSEAESILEEMAANLRNKEKVSGIKTINKAPAPETIQMFRKFRQEIAENQAAEEENRLNNLSDEEFQQEDDRPGPTGLERYDDRAKSVFDKKELLKDDGAGGSAGIRTIRDKIDWVKLLENQINRLQEDMINYPLKEKPKVKKLIEACEKLREAYIKNEDIVKMLSENNVSDEQIKNSPKFQAEIANVNKELDVAKKARALASLNLRKYSLLTDKKNAIEEALNHAPGSKERFILDQTILLKDGLLSRDAGKAEVNKLRKKLIQSMTNGNSIPDSMIQNFLQKIEEASSFILQKKHLNKDEAAKIKSIKLSGSLAGNTQKLQESISDVKRKVKPLCDAEEKTKNLEVYLPYLQAIEKARSQGNQTLVDQITYELNEKLDSSPLWVTAQEQIKQLYSIRDMFKSIDKSGKLGEKDLSTEEIQGIENMMSGIKDFVADLTVNGNPKFSIAIKWVMTCVDQVERLLHEEEGVE